jgi:hypothetical protein
MVVVSNGLGSFSFNFEKHVCDCCVFLFCWDAVAIGVPVPVPVVNAELGNITADDYVNVPSVLPLCRTAAKDTKIAYEELSHQQSSERTADDDLSGGEDRLVARVVELLHADEQKFGNSTSPIYIKGLYNTELSSILSSLQAEKVYLDRKEATYFPEYFDFMRNFQSKGEEDTQRPTSEDRSSNSGGNRSRSSSITESFHRVSSMLGGLLSGNNSDASSDEDEWTTPKSGKNGKKMPKSIPTGNVYYADLILLVH